MTSKEELAARYSDCMKALVETVYIRMRALSVLNRCRWITSEIFRIVEAGDTDSAQGGKDILSAVAGDISGSGQFSDPSEIFSRIGETMDRLARSDLSDPENLAQELGKSADEIADVMKSITEEPYRDDHTDILRHLDERLHTFRSFDPEFQLFLVKTLFGVIVMRERVYEILDQMNVLRDKILAFGKTAVSETLCGSHAGSGFPAAVAAPFGKCGGQSALFLKDLERLRKSMDEKVFQCAEKNTAALVLRNLQRAIDQLRDRLFPPAKNG